MSRTPQEILRAAERYLGKRGVEAARAEAEILLGHVLGIGRAGTYAADGVEPAEANAFATMLCQRASGVPLQHLTGDQPFLDLDLRVRPGVFVPRPETEVLVERCLALLGGVEAPAVVDVGTGTGAIALAIASHRRDARVWATDVSPEAVALARENAAAHDLEVEVLHGDLLEPLPGAMRGAVDLLVSNPPYVTEEEYEDLPPEVRADPYEALVGGTEVHRRLAAEAPTWLRAGGWLALEIGEAQGQEVAEAVSKSLTAVEVLSDLAGRDRIVLGRLGDAHG